LSSSSGAKAGQAEVVLVGCGAPNRGMGWYHAIQMLEGRYVVFCLVVLCVLYSCAAFVDCGYMCIFFVHILCAFFDMGGST